LRAVVDPVVVIRHSSFFRHWIICHSSFLVSLTCALYAPGCAAPSSRFAQNWPLADFFTTGANRKAPESGEAWWAKNKHRAVFVEGKGYTLDGVAGFFDEKGRPIGAQASVLEDTGVPRPTDEIAPAPRHFKEDDQKTLYERVTSIFRPRPDERQARLAAEEAEALFRKKEYAAAATRFKRAAALWPDSPLEEEALFQYAESKFFADDYPDANDGYNKLVKEYPGSRHLDEIVVRQFAIARYWHQFHDVRPRWPITPNMVDKTRHSFDTLGHALKTYENIRLNDPTGPLADDALMATASAHFTLGHYEEADYHYGLLRREYPKSEHQFQAHVLGLHCKLRRYQGPAYDGKVLEEAEQLIAQLLTQFPDQLGNERERVLQTRAEVAAQRALRDWNLAEYYAKGQHYRAARHYYQKVADDHPQTKLAAESRTRLADIEGRPDTAPQRLAWLTNLFPEDSAAANSASATNSRSSTRR
jgi:outer membrane protein assembly factor BamD (BamD/ComL family)